MNDYTSSYRSRLLSLNLLPLMNWFELQDVMFLVKSLQDPADNLDLSHHIVFLKSATRAGNSGNKLKFKYKRTSAARHFYLNRIVRLWNSFPNEVIDLSKSFLTIKHRIYNHLWSNFKHNFTSENICSFHFVCPCFKCSLYSCKSNDGL